MLVTTNFAYRLLPLLYTAPLVLPAQNNHTFPGKPNLLIIHNDEHNFRTLGCYRDLLPEKEAFVWGNGIKVETPNIDWIGKNGMIFTKFYASTPVCSPSRASLMTGKYPHHTGVTTNDVPMWDNQPTFASVLKDAGYITGYAGKWHLDGDGKPQWKPARNFGFEDNKYMYNRGHWKKLEDTPAGPRVAAENNLENPAKKLVWEDSNSFTTDFLTNKTIGFIEKNNPEKTGKPFCFMVAYPDPHNPDIVRPPYDKLFTGLPYQAPVSFNKTDEGVPSWAAKNKNENNIDQSQYFGMVKCIDDNVGKILDFLKKGGLIDNTIIVFTSDHGDLRAEHHRQNKGVPLEASAKIPFMIYYPQKIKAGSTINTTYSTVDFAPSILSFIGVKVPVDMQGRDFSNLILHPEKQNTTDDIVIIRSTGRLEEGNWIGAFTSRYKLILSRNDEPWLLDLNNDPFELQNQLNKPESAALIKDLASKLSAYAQKYDDPFLKSTKMSDDLKKLLN